MVLWSLNVGFSLIAVGAYLQTSPNCHHYTSIPDTQTEGKTQEYC